MSQKFSENQISQLAKQNLEESLEQIDNTVCAQLQLARHQALQGHDEQHPVIWVPVAVFSVSIFIGSIFWYLNEKPVISDDELFLVEEVMSSEESQDMMENIDFYQWLAENGGYVG